MFGKSSMASVESVIYQFTIELWTVVSQLAFRLLSSENSCLHSARDISSIFFKEGYWRMCHCSLSCVHEYHVLSRVKAQLMPLPHTVSCFSKIQIGFTFLVPAHLGSPGQRAVKRVCVCCTLQNIFNFPGNMHQSAVGCSRFRWSHVCNFRPANLGSVHIVVARLLIALSLSFVWFLPNRINSVLHWLVCLRRDMSRG